MIELPQRTSPRAASGTASLDSFFHPHGVAVIGASQDPTKLSYAVVHNLLDLEAGYHGPVYPVNPHADAILGCRCYPDISAVPDPVELAVLVVPAEGMPTVIEACGERGIRAVVIISGGFREVGEMGAAREREVVEIARRYGMRVMGPNCIGVIDTHTPLNTTFVRGMPERGHIAFVSQSGALCGGIIDWIIGSGLGFSRLLSMGNEADVNETDMLWCLADDDETHVITLYLEDIKGGPAFISALRDDAAHKPVLALKAGRTASGQTATASHTGALAGVHSAFRALCRQTGVIECDTLKGMFDAALALAYQPLLRGPRIAILTNAGGPAALAADAMEPLGLTLARTSPTTQAVLRRFLLRDAQVAGPVDMLGGASERDYEHALAAMLDDEKSDGVLIIQAPQAVVDPTAVVQAVGEVALTHAGGKPIVACLLGEASLDAAFAAAHMHRIPAYTFPEEAAAALGALYQRAHWLATVHPSPSMVVGMDVPLIQQLLEAVQVDATKVKGSNPNRPSVLSSPSRRHVLDAAQGQMILQAAGLAVPTSELVASAEAAVAAADRIGFPVALKLISAQITHKSDVGGVLLDVGEAAAVREGFKTLMKRARLAQPEALIRGVQVQQMVKGGLEVIVGVTRDPSLGPLVMFGMGGIYAEALADVSFRLAPLSRQDAEELIGEARASRLLVGLRGAPPSDREALIDVLLRVGWLVHNCPQVGELDINPLIVLPEGQGVFALDVRLVVWQDG